MNQFYNLQGLCFSTVSLPIRHLHSIKSTNLSTRQLHTSTNPLKVRPLIVATTPPPQESSSNLAVENALLINSVPFLWGSYGPITEILYDIDPTLPIPLLNLFAYIAAFGSLVAAQIFRTPSNNNSSSFLPAFELGSYLYFASWLNLISLKLTSASRAAFLVQLTTAFIPILDSLRGTRLSPQIIFACCLAIFGAGILAVDTELSSSASTIAENASPNLFGAFNVGDALAVVAALCYSIHVIRLQMLTKKVADPLTLVRQKGIAQVMLSVATLLGLYFLGDHSSWQYLTTLPSFSQNHVISSVACIVWIGAATTALATWAQVVGQQRVGPSRAAIFYATQPVWAVVIATSLGMDKLSVGELVGGGFIVAAGLTLAVAEKAGNLTKKEK